MPEETPQLAPVQNPLVLEMLGHALTDIPEGVRNFLTTELPDGPTLTAPSDVDKAIICQAEFCVWLGQLFGQFKGLTPIQIPMMIGQLNTVNHGLLLSTLEYREETQAAQEFEIVEPTEGERYGPGELRITAKASSNTEIDGMTATITEAETRAIGEPFDMIEIDGVWRQYVHLPDYGEFSLSITATFADGEQAATTQNVSFAIVDPDNPEEDPEPPGGKDEEAVKEATSKIKEALNALADQSVLDVPAYAQKWVGVLKTYYSVLGNVAGKVLDGDAAGAVDTLLTEAQGVIDNFEENIENPDMDADPLSMGRLVSKLWSIADWIGGLWD